MTDNIPSMRYLPGGDNDPATSFARVQIKYPDSALTVNVGESWIEWGTDPDGMTGADIEVDQDATMRLRFQESNRVLVCDSSGVRVYDSDTELVESLIVDLSHEDYHDGVTPKVFDRGAIYNDDGETDAFHAAVQVAAGLLSGGENPEYDRGVIEFIATLHGRQGVFTQDREAEVRTALDNARQTC